MADFEGFWRGCCGGRPPICYRLRQWFGNSGWVRFHSLPGSKRYPDNNAEMGIVFDRANTLANRVLGEGSDCWMVANSFPNQAEEVAEVFPQHRLVRDAFGLEEAYSWRDPFEGLEDQILWTTYAREVTWRHGEFDQAIKIIADDIERNIMWVSKDSKSVFHPYDGGVDLIVRDFETVSYLKKEFADWLSDHPDGL